MNSVVKQLMYVLKLFRVTAASRAMFSHSHFGSIDVKKTLLIMYPKYPDLDMIQGIHQAIVDYSDQ